MSFSLAASKILSFCFILGNVIMMCFGVFFFGSNLLGLYELPGHGYLFSSPNWGSFLSLFFQISFEFLGLTLLLLVSLCADIFPFHVICWELPCLVSEAVTPHD